MGATTDIGRARVAGVLAFALAVLALSWVDEARGGVASVCNGNACYQAPAGEDNTLDVSPAAGGQGVVFTDATAPVTAGAGCTSLNAHAASCMSSSGAAVSVITVGDLDDSVAVTDVLVGGVSGGAGNDTLTSFTTFGFTSGVWRGDGGNDTITASEGGRLRGGTGDDTLTGGSLRNELEDGPGDDSVAGGGGDDSIFPGKGEDGIDGGPGRDTLDYSGETHLSVVVDLGAGRAVVGGEEDTIVSVSNVVGTVFPDTLIGDEGRNQLLGAGASGGDRILGAGGADKLVASSRGPGDDDRLNGGTGNDLLRGSDFADVLIGGAGHDVLNAGSGHDRLYARDGEADAVNGGAGNDRAQIDRRLDETDSIESFLPATARSLALPG